MRKGHICPFYKEQPFLLQNIHGGTRKAVKEYGYIYMNLKGGSETLTIYQFASETDPGYNGGLFIPFTDRTNYKQTFPGRRYIDVSLDSIHDNTLIVDFNKAYNPHTSYQKGYPYIMPPSNNNLRVEIKAGEKIFVHNPGY